MKRHFSSIAVLFLLICGSASAATSRSSAEHSSAAGIILGEPTGLTGKYWFNNRTAFDAGLAYSWNDFVLIYGDYLWHFPGLLGKSSEVSDYLEPYFGGGLMMLIRSSTQYGTNAPYFNSNQGSVGLGIRIPIGAEWKSPTLPIAPFVELVPGVGIVPTTFGFIQGGVGIRYYF